MQPLSPRLPKTLSLSAYANGDPLPGALFRIELPMSRKNDYVFLIGPADEAGRYEATGAQLEAETQRTNSLLLMDFVGLGAGWTGEINVQAVGRNGLRLARQGYDTWAAADVFPADYVDWLDRLEAELARLSSTAELTVECVIDPP